LWKTSVRGAFSELVAIVLEEGEGERDLQREREREKKRKKKKKKKKIIRSVFHSAKKRDFSGCGKRLRSFSHIVMRFHIPFSEKPCYNGVKARSRRIGKEICAGKFQVKAIEDVSGGARSVFASLMMICETADGGSEIRLKNMERVSANEFELSSPVNGIPYLICTLDPSVAP
jgi:hypothetical protein